MQRGPLIAACATVAVAAGLAVFVASRDSAEESDRDGGISLHDFDAKGSSRSGKTPQEENGPAQLTDRTPTPANPLGVANPQDLDRLLSPAQRDQLQQSLADAAERRKNQGSSEEADHRRLAAAQDAEILREKIASAVATDPDNWVSTYEDLYSDYIARHHPNLSPGFGSGGTGGGDDGSGDGGEPGDGGGEAPAPDPTRPNLEEAAELRKIYDQRRATEPPFLEYLDPRFRLQP